MLMFLLLLLLFCCCCCCCCCCCLSSFLAIVIMFHLGEFVFQCNCEDAEPDVPQEAVKPGTALDCSQFEETQVAAFDNDEYFTTRKSDIIYAVEVQEVSESR